MSEENNKEIPTAESLLKENFLLIEDGKTCDAHTHLVTKQMIEFAKLHVKAALANAAKSAKTKEEWYQSNECPDGFAYETVDRESILNSYPDERIK